MKVDVSVSTPMVDTFRANRVRSLFNVDFTQASTHSVSVDLPVEEKPWRVGAIIGPSGSGKTTLGRRLFGGGAFHDGFAWPEDKPILDAIAPDAPSDDVTNALSAVGLGTVPSWLRPFHVLSRGEQFRADLARVLLEVEGDVVVDEFTSVVDRQVAQIGAGAFAKAWRRKPTGRVVVLSCHYDVVEWLQPEWVLDTRDWHFGWRSLQRPPSIRVDIHESPWSRWRLFEKHHYLKLSRPVACTSYVGWVGDTPVAHLAVATMAGMKNARITRMVVMPDWQGAGVGMRFLDAVAQMWLDGENRYRKKMPGIIHTSHPGLISALRRNKRWVVQSQQMGSPGGKARRLSLFKSGFGNRANGYGGHDRAVSGFKFIGDAAGAGAG